MGPPEAFYVGVLEAMAEVQTGDGPAAATVGPHDVSTVTDNVHT